MVNVVDGRNFHVRVIEKNAHYNKIESLMNAFAPNTQPELFKPILKGTICAAKYSEDGKWYRAKVLASMGGSKIHVSFIDYGNTAVINIDDPKILRKLPANLLQYEPCAVACKMAYIKVPGISKF